MINMWYVVFVFDIISSLLSIFCRSKQNLKVREHNILGPYVDGLSMLAVASFEVTSQLLRWVHTLYVNINRYMN